MAGVGGVATRAIGAFPAWLADTHAAVTDSIVRPRAEKAVVIVTRKVVAFAEITIDNLDMK